MLRRVVLVRTDVSEELYVTYNFGAVASINSAASGYVANRHRIAIFSLKKNICLSTGCSKV
jgi:hypothetical protein